MNECADIFVCINYSWMKIGIYLHWNVSRINVWIYIYTENIQQIFSQINIFIHDTSNIIKYPNILNELTLYFLHNFETMHTPFDKILGTMYTKYTGRMNIVLL